MYKERKVIGICTSWLDQEFHTRLLKRVVKEIIDIGYYAFLFGSDSDMYYFTDSDFGDASVFDVMSLDIIDVVLLFSDTIRQEGVVSQIVKRAVGEDIPVISVGQELNRCYNVVYDTDTAFEGAVRHVVEYHGAKEVNFISGVQGNEIAERRLEIYKHVLEDNDILYEEERVGYGDFWYGPTRAVMDTFIQPTKVPPEAIICANDTMAIVACDYLREHNIMVPDEIIVVGIDGLDEGIKHTPAITTCVRDDFNDAKTIVGLVAKLCEGQSIDRTTILEYHMQLSQSCGCQETHLFDRDTLIERLNFSLGNCRWDLKQGYQMSEKFLHCEKDEDFWRIVGEYMPDNSFVCINSDLHIGQGTQEGAEKKDGFTVKMQAMVKADGEIIECECLREQILPEEGVDLDYDSSVVIMPLHYCEKVIGYMGVWGDFRNGFDFLQRVMYFLLHFNISAGVRLGTVCK